MMNFAGKTIVVTGGASGIGQALTLALAARGASVAVADVNMQGLEETVQTGNEAAVNGANIRGYALDVTDWDGWQAFRDAVLADFGAVDGIVNNAGITVVTASKDMTQADLDKIMQVNFNGMVYGGKTFMQDLLARPEGFIANVSSVFGLFGVKDQAAYCASKFAIRGYTEAMMEDFRGSNLHIASIHPGHIGTDILKNTIEAEQGDAFKARDIDRDRAGKRFKKLGLPPSKAADIILDGLARKKHWITVGKDAFVMRRLLGWLPTWGPRLINRMIRREETRVGMNS